MAKVRLGSYIVQTGKVRSSRDFFHTKIRYGWGFNEFEILNKVQMRSYIFENAEIRYS